MKNEMNCRLDIIEKDIQSMKNVLGVNHKKMQNILKRLNNLEKKAKGVRE